MDNPAFWICLAIAYLCGSIPFGLLIGLMRGVDIRKHGSHNIGATNCGRVLGRAYGLTCFGLDVLKGLLPVLAAGLFFGWVGQNAMDQQSVWMWLMIAIAPVLGHVLPVWLGFRGGKGVATGFGVVLGVWPYLTGPAVAALVTWLLFASVFRYVGLASVVAALMLPGWFLVATQAWGWPLDTLWPMLVILGLMGLVVVVRHLGNLRRIALGTEAQLGG